MVDKETLVKLYTIDRNSLVAIANILSVTNSTIHNWLKFYNIPRRTISEALTGKKLSKEHCEKNKINLRKIGKRRSQNGVSEKEKERLKSIKPDRTGIAHSEITKKKMSQAAVGRIISDSTKLKMSEIRLDNPKYSGPNHPLYGKQRLDITGEKHFNWYGGVSTIYKKIRGMTKYSEWRTMCFKRDNYTCVLCFKHGGFMHVDHIKPFATIVKEHNLTTTVEATLCEKLWDVNNGRTLCVACHRKTDTYGRPHNKESERKIG